MMSGMNHIPKCKQRYYFTLKNMMVAHIVKYCTYLNM